MADTQLTPSSARASATYSTYVAANAIDGDTGTNWSAPSNAYHWLEVDLGSVQDFSKLRFYQGAAGEEYDFWISADGFEWHQVAGSTAVADDAFTDITFHPVSARYVLCRHTVGNDWANASEVEVWMEESYTSYTPGTRVARYLAGPDFTGDAVATASSTYTGADPYEPIELEGYEQSGTSEKWLSNGAAEGEWLKLDLGQAVPITRVLVHSGNSSSVDFTVETSSDDSTWDAFDTTKVGVANRLSPLSFTDDEVTARYVRVTAGNVSGSDWCEITGLYVETDAAIAEYGATPATPGDWELVDGSSWTIVGTLHRRITSTADEYGTAEYGYSRYGGYSVVDSEDVSAYLVAPLTIRRGKNYFRDEFRAGVATVLLDNVDGRFSDTASHYSRPGDFLELAAAVVSGATDEERPLFFGRIDSARDVMTPSGRELVALVAYDAFPDLAGLETPGVAEPGVGDGETFRVRMARLIAESSEAVGELETFGTSANFADPTLLPTTLSENRLSEIHRTVATEGGEFWIAPGPVAVGDDLRPVAVQAGRDWPDATRSSTVQASFGDTDIGIVDAVRSSERARVVNEATIANEGGIPQTYRVETASLIAPYGRRTYRRTDLIGDTDSDALALATHIVTVLKDLAPAVRSVTVPVVDGDSLLAATGLDFLDLISYSIDGLAAWSLTGYAHIIGIQHSIEAGSDWVVTFTLDETQAEAP